MAEEKRKTPASAERRRLEPAGAETGVGRGGTSEADRLGREQQRRATAYARARGQL